MTHECTQSTTFCLSYYHLLLQIAYGIWNGLIDIYNDDDRHDEVNADVCWQKAKWLMINF